MAPSRSLFFTLPAQRGDKLLRREVRSILDKNQISQWPFCCLRAPREKSVSPDSFAGPVRRGPSNAPLKALPLASYSRKNEKQVASAPSLPLPSAAVLAVEPPVPGTEARVRVPPPGSHIPSLVAGCLPFRGRGLGPCLPWAG